MTMTTTPTPPKGRRWLRVGEVLRKFDRYHLYVLERWIHTTSPGARVIATETYSRAIRRKTTRK